ncbi:hypothetical protein ACHAXR_005113 [Thalassiosira sp. AJA248-18]
MIKAWRPSVLHSWIDHVTHRLNPAFVTKYRTEGTKSWLKTKRIRGKDILTKKVSGSLQRPVYVVGQRSTEIQGLARLKKEAICAWTQLGIASSVESSPHGGSGHKDQVCFFLEVPPPSHRAWDMEGQPHFLIGDLPTFKKLQ